jgi:ketosteroid isomerase-like protein
MGTGNVTNQELADLVGRTAEAASAFIRGNMRRYLTLIRHADDYTLMAPSGGEPRRGFDTSDQAVEALAEYFRGCGEADLQVFESYTSGDLVVLVAVERQHGEVAGLPDQDWSLRVTLVFRREGSGWRLAHRHADPLVREITMEQVASLASG